MKELIQNVLYLTFFLLLISCKESKEKRIIRLIKEWEGKEIIFPEHSIFTIAGKDTIDFNFQDAEYKVVTYMDSTGCTSCKLQLLEWQELIAEVDSITGNRIPFIFYFHPKDLKELRYLIHYNGFINPICIDEKDSFNELNRFPSQMSFQTFLLNQKNKVIAVGNPIHSRKIKQLYLQLITNNSINN